MQHYTVYFIWKLLYMFQVVPPPITRSVNDHIYSTWYLSQRYCYLPLSWKSWNWFECAVGGVHHPQHTQTSGWCTSPTAHSNHWVVYTTHSTLKPLGGAQHPQHTQTTRWCTPPTAHSNHWVVYTTHSTLKPLGGVHHPQHTQTSSNSSTIAADSK